MLLDNSFSSAVPADGRFKYSLHHNKLVRSGIPHGRYSTRPRRADLYFTGNQFFESAIKTTNVRAILM